MDYRMNAYAEIKDEFDLSENILDLKTMRKKGN